jgi:hypothetical protein
VFLLSKTSVQVRCLLFYTHEKEVLVIYEHSSLLWQYLKIPEAECFNLLVFILLVFILLVLFYLFYFTCFHFTCFHFTCFILLVLLYLFSFYLFSFYLFHFTCFTYKMFYCVICSLVIYCNTLLSKSIIFDCLHSCSQEKRIY